MQHGIHTEVTTTEPPSSPTIPYHDRTEAEAGAAGIHVPSSLLPLAACSLLFQ